MDTLAIYSLCVSQTPCHVKHIQKKKKGGCCQPRIASSHAKGGVELNSIHRDRLW